MILAGIILILLILLVVVGAPAATLWSLNQLFQTNIHLGFYNIVAFWVLFIVFDLASGK